MTIKTRPFDPAEYLATPEAIAEYLAAAFETGEPAVIADALGVAARAHGMTALARDTGLSRSSLYRALSAQGEPELSTVLKVMHALGLELAPVPASTTLEDA